MDQDGPVSKLITRAFSMRDIEATHVLGGRERAKQA